MSDTLATPFARMEARLGRITARRFANARLRAGSDAAVAGVFERMPAAVLGMVAERPTFTCLLDDISRQIPGGLGEGQRVELESEALRWEADRFWTGEIFRIALRHDLPELGQAVLELEKVR